jgi:hypothetical protein
MNTCPRSDPSSSRSTQPRPDAVAFVVALPAEVRSVVAGRLPVDICLDRDEPELAGSIGPQLHDRRTEELERVALPRLHGDDAPPADDVVRHLATLAARP